MALTSKTDQFIPIPSFYFRVEIDNEPVSFQEVSGLESTLEFEEISEGGNNENKIRLPLRFTYTNLILSRGLVKGGDSFSKWVKNALMNEDTLNKPIEDNMKSIRIDLLSTNDGESIEGWNIVKAYPVKWSVSSFNSSENKIAIETIELTFQYLNGD